MRCIAAAVALAGVAGAQATPEDSVIRITTSLVQIDAIVTDRDGKLVTNLEAQDFEIFQDAKPRDITAFTLVEVALDSQRQAPPERSRDKAIPPPQLQPAGIAREQVRRTMAILVDDLNLAFPDLTHVRQAVTRFVAEDLREGDLVAIITTRGGMGMYSQFTTNRALLAEAAARLVWSQGAQPESVSIPGIASEEIRALRAGSFGAILGGIQAMREMPGRKSIVLFSAGSVSSDPGDRLLESVADEATRAAVTIYPIHTRGVANILPVPVGPGPPDDELTPAQRDAKQMAVRRQTAEQDLALGDMAYLAERSGGVAFRGGNDMRELLVRALDDQSSYYLLGYNPGKDSFDRKFHKIYVRVKRPGLAVRSRTGYVGVEDRPGRRELVTAERRMVRALLAPLQANDLHTRLTATFRSDGNKPRVLSQLWIDGADLKFERWEDGKYHTEVEVIVANFDPQGSMQEHTERGYRINLDQEQFDEARRSGLLYTISYAARKPGAYHVRMAVREKGTEHVGTASQFLVTPDLGKERLAMSGIIVKGYEDKKLSDDVSKPWMVLLKLGRGIEWEAQVYHPKLNKGMPRLMASMRLYREGQLLMEAKPELVWVKAPLKKKERDVPVSGRVFLGDHDPPGEYVLQLIVSDENDKSKAVTQAISFLVVR